MSHETTTTKFAYINRLIYHLRFAQHAVQSIPNLLASAAEGDEWSELYDSILCQERDEYDGLQEDLHRAYVLLPHLVVEIRSEIVMLPHLQRDRFLEINGDMLTEMGVI